MCLQRKEFFPKERCYWSNTLNSVWVTCELGVSVFGAAKLKQPEVHLRPLEWTWFMSAFQLVHLPGAPFVTRLALLPRA